MKKYISNTLLLIFLISCGNNKKKDEHSHDEESENIASNEEKHEEGVVHLTENQVEIAGFEYGTFEMKNLKDVIRVSGETNLPPQNKAVVTTLISGNIKDIFIEEGDKVKKGQVLAVVENPDFLALQREYYRAVNASSYTKKEYECQKKLYEEKVTARKKYELAKANYDAEQADIKGLASQLRQFGIIPSKVRRGNFTRTFPVIAPISGFIGHIDASIGSFTGLRQELFTIVDNSKIHLDLNLYEQDLSKVKLGQKVSFVLTNSNKSIIEGEIFAIGKTFEPDTKTVSAHATVNNSKHELVANMFVNAIIEIGDNQVKALPEEAVVKIKGKDYIFIKEKHEKMNAHEIPFKMVEVITGESELGYIGVEPIETIDKASQIIIKNTYFIQSQKILSEGGGGHGH